MTLSHVDITDFPRDHKFEFNSNAFMLYIHSFLEFIKYNVRIYLNFRDSHCLDAKQFHFVDEFIFFMRGK